MGKFNLGPVTGTNVVVGDNAVINAGSTGSAQVAELSRQVHESAASIQQMEAALEELRAVLQERPVRKERVRELLATLTAGAGTLTAMLDGIEKVRQALGLNG